MDLKSMIEREDFFTVFFDTIRDYYKAVYGEDVKIEISDKKNSNLVIKPFLSATASPKISKAARSFFYSEWNVRNSLIKYILAKCGVFFFTHSGKAFSIYTFRMTPEESVSKDIVIAPNNRSVRFFDYRQKTVGCMVKKGFTKKYFLNQLEFRKQFSYPFMLPMIKWGDDWFVEPILSGHPLARVTDSKAYVKCMTDALNDIAMLATDTTEYSDTEEYVQELLPKIGKFTEDAVNKKKIRTAEKTLFIAKKAAGYTAELQTIPLCMTHGDFQSGNIWAGSDGKTLIYDWETAGKRSVWYDSSVLSYSLRRVFGWKELAEELNPEKMLNCDPNPEHDGKEYKAMKSVVLLEDIVFYLEDMMELPFDWGAEIYDSFINRIADIKF